MLWAITESDPTLLESNDFLGEAGFRIWLAGIVTRYGRGNVTVDWTTALASDVRLAAAVRACVDAS
jgi:hypothetical protein